MPYLEKGQPRFMSFISNFSLFLFKAFTSQIKINNQEYKLHIVDTAGQVVLTVILN